MEIFFFAKIDHTDLDLTGDRALDVVELVYRHLHWVNAPRAFSPSSGPEVLRRRCGSNA